MNILLTGGTGYIGSHTAVVLAQAGHRVVLFDNYSNSKPTVVHRLQDIVGHPLQAIEGDVRDTALLTSVLKEEQIEAIM